MIVTHWVVPTLRTVIYLQQIPLFHCYTEYTKLAYLRVGTSETTYAERKIVCAGISFKDLNCTWAL